MNSIPSRLRQSLALLVLCLIVPKVDSIGLPFVGLSFIATANAVILAGAKPVFADISDHDCDILTEGIQKFINDHTKALSCQYISMAEVPIWKQSMLLQDFIAAYDS